MNRKAPSSYAKLAAAALLGGLLSRAISVWASSNAQVGYNRIEYRPIHREWNSANSNWDSEIIGAVVGGNEGIPQQIQIYSAPLSGPRPNERIMVQLNNDGKLTAMVFDGINWGNAITLTSGLVAQITYVPFDGAYMVHSSSFVLVFSNGGTAVAPAGTQIQWEKWDGSSWSNGNFPSEPITAGQAARWVRVGAVPMASTDTVVAVVAGTDNELYESRYD